MPEYLPLGPFRQGLLPGDCSFCAWWQTAGALATHGMAASGRRHEWLSDLEHEWGSAGLLVHHPAATPNSSRSGNPVITASIHFAPASSLARFRELPFPALPPFSALLFCLRTDEDAPRWTTKRLIRKAIYELRKRGVDEVYAVAHRPGCRNGAGPDCRFFCAELLAENGFSQVDANGHICLMRVDSRGLVSLVDQAEMALRRLFAPDHEPAPSPAAWAEGRNGAEQGTR